MKTRLLAATLLAVSALAVEAEASTLFARYRTLEIPGSTATNYVSQYDAGTLTPKAGNVDAPININISGLAWGQGSLYVASDENHNVTRFDAGGMQTGSIDFGPFITPDELAFGGGKVWAATDVFNFSATGYAVAGLTTDLTLDSSFTVPQQIDGLAASDSNVFVAYGQTLARYDLAGNLLNATDLGFGGFGPAPWDLAYGDGKLFVAYSVFGIPNSAYGIGVYDATDFSLLGGWSTPTLANGLAYGDGGLFVALDSDIVRYDPSNGAGTAEVPTDPIAFDGALAFKPDSVGGPITGGCRDTSKPCEHGGGGVPEPQAWALMILGFGAAGAMLRTRRRAQAQA